ncbi:MAG: hypothetical protein ACYSU7_15285 [Planctomycetota bacterium]
MYARTQLNTVVAAAFALATAGTATADYFQGFELDTDGWIDFGGTTTRVASGTNGITSATGGYHAEVVVGPGTGDGAFTRFGGYSSVWPGHIFQLLDVYIDPAADSIGDGWFLDNAVNNNAGSWTEAGGVGALKATDGFWWVAADADGGAYPGPASGGVGLKITAAGWYTIVSEWNANGDALTVDRNTFIYDSGGTLLYSNYNLQLESIPQLRWTPLRLDRGQRADEHHARHRQQPAAHPGDREHRHGRELRHDPGGDRRRRHARRPHAGGPG